MTISLAPVGADPNDPDAWAPLGQVVDPPGFTTDEGDFAARKAIAVPTGPVSFEATLKTADHEALRALFGGAPRNPHQSATVDVVDGGLVKRIEFPSVTTREFTDLEREGEWARRHVAQLLSAAFPDLVAAQNRGVPDDAYTDNLIRIGVDPGRWTEPDPWSDFRSWMPPAKFLPAK